MLQYAAYAAYAFAAYAAYAAYAGHTSCLRRAGEAQHELRMLEVAQLCNRANCCCDTLIEEKAFPIYAIWGR